MRTLHFLLFALLSFSACGEKDKAITPVLDVEKDENKDGVSLVVLGTVQDAGYPHIACKKECCADLFKDSKKFREVVSLGVIDYANDKSYLFEATPDITTQLKYLKEKRGASSSELPDGVFLTHAHIGHYTGLMYLGKEATNTDKIPVFAMPKMKAFLKQNGPWSQLVQNNNITIEALENKSEVILTDHLKAVPFTVPHRDEYSETVGYKIIGPNKSALFIPDINKWSLWKTSIRDLVNEVDYAFLDATFFDGEELNTRDIKDISHPFVIESMDLFKSLPASERKKIYFIHFNHTNPLLLEDSPQTKQVLDSGYRIARKGFVLEL